MSPEDADDFERTLALGKQLAHDLDSDDILGRWMAHHLGDLIVRAEITTGAQGEALRREAADLTIRLWEHRSTTPLRSRPTEALQPAMDALQRLGETGRWRFYNMFNLDTGPDHDDIAGNALLRVALDMESTVRDAVRHIIVAAAEEAADTESSWLAAAAHLQPDDQVHVLQLIRRMRRRHMVSDELTDAGDTAMTNATHDTDQRTDPLAVLRATEARLESLTAAVRRQIAAAETAETYSPDDRIVPCETKPMSHGR